MEFTNEKKIKSIKARCKEKVYADDIPLFYVNDVLDFDLFEVKVARPEWTKDGSFKDEETWDSKWKSLETGCRYEVKKGCFTFCFFDRATASIFGKPCFDDAFMELNMELTAENVGKIFIECLSKEDKKENACLVKAVLDDVSFAFDKEKLKIYEPEITSWVNELPNEFKKENGGGWSFLNLCTTKSGRQWTGLHVSMQELLCLAIGIGKMDYLLPRKLWDILPGGMPYVCIV